MRTLLCLIIIILIHGLVLASIDTQAGPYRIALTTQPKVIPVGNTTLTFAITDSSGKNV